MAKALSAAQEAIKTIQTMVFVKATWDVAALHDLGYAQELREDQHQWALLRCTSRPSLKLHVYSKGHA